MEMFLKLCGILCIDSQYVKPYEDITDLAGDRSISLLPGEKLTEEEMCRPSTSVKKKKYISRVPPDKESKQPKTITKKNHCMTSSQQQIDKKAEQESMERLKKPKEGTAGWKQIKDKVHQEWRSCKKTVDTCERALATVKTKNGPKMVSDVYGDALQEKPRAKKLENYKQKELLNRKLAEIQRKFDNELLYHLEIIKKQKREIKLQSQILEKIEPMLSKKCNYRNLKRLKDDAEWKDDEQSWIIPELKRIKMIPDSDERRGGRQVDIRHHLHSLIKNK